jgi:ubiquinone/menaquinone biosynthesis C-methylase UbiE
MVGTTNEAVRKEWLEDTLKKLPHGLRLLDAGAGELANKKFCKHLGYVSQDFCQYEGNGDNKGLQMGSWDTNQIDIVGDITNIPEEDGSFDVVLCTEVLEHLPDPVKALNEFHRLLKKGGTLILTAPFCSLTHFAPYHYSSGFNSYFYSYHLENFGFTLEESTRNGNFFEYLGQEIHRIPSMADKYSSQKTSRIERFAMKIVLSMLERFSKKDTTSNEVLCFGYQVVAVKQ